MNDLERTFVAAGKSLSLVWLTEPSGHYRIVEPYMVFVSSRGKRLFHLYQIGGYSAGGGYDRPQRQMFAAVCSQCGKETQVPFQPRGDKPVYCSDCFAQQRQSSGGGYGRDRY